jgi:hypothetical protein
VREVEIVSGADYERRDGLLGDDGVTQAAYRQVRRAGLDI